MTEKASYSKAVPRIFLMPFHDYFEECGSDETFEKDTYISAHLWEGTGRFRIEGLAVWGATEETTLLVTPGRDGDFNQILRAEYFSSSFDLEDLAFRLELAGVPYPSIQDTNEELVHYLGKSVKKEQTFRCLDDFPGPDVIALQVWGPIKAAAFWGYHQNRIITRVEPEALPWREDD